jgi:hypothetical protein
MGSCSSYVHYFKPLDRRRRAIKSKCRFYLTANVCSADHALIFVQQVFKGNDPTSARGSRAILRALNGAADSEP